MSVLQRIKASALHDALLVLPFASVPMLVCVGFVALASSPGFAMLAVLVVIRRIGEYAFIRPGRELLFASLG